MRKLWIKRIVLGLLAISLLGTGMASFYFFHVAQVRAEKSFINNAPTAKSDPLYEDEQKFDQLFKEILWMNHQGVKQDAWYVKADQETDKTVIIVHGFTQSKEKMKAYGWLFHELGYNVLMPDNVASGDSGGRIIGYGWNDRLNLMKWIDILLERQPNSQITLYGLSMGAATVMMASGEKLPAQVKTIIEDAGYTSVWDELKYQAKDMYGLPAFPILYGVSSISKLRAGFSYGQASAVNQLSKNTRPTLFIHGDADDFVPTEMVYENYHATKGPKELYIVKGAGHAKTLAKDKLAYREQIEKFLKKYEE